IERRNDHGHPAAVTQPDAADAIGAGIGARSGIIQRPHRVAKILAEQRAAQVHQPDKFDGTRVGRALVLGDTQPTSKGGETGTDSEISLAHELPAIIVVAGLDRPLALRRIVYAGNRVMSVLSMSVQTQDNRK